MVLLSSALTGWYYQANEKMSKNHKNLFTRPEGSRSYNSSTITNSKMLYLFLFTNRAETVLVARIYQVGTSNSAAYNVLVKQRFGDLENENGIMPNYGGEIDAGSPCLRHLMRSVHRPGKQFHCNL